MAPKGGRDMILLRERTRPGLGIIETCLPSPAKAPPSGPVKLSIIIPCFNEQATLQRCVERVMKIASDSFQLEIIIVDDCSTDYSLSIARDLAARYQTIQVLAHPKNIGKGAAIRNGIGK